MEPQVLELSLSTLMGQLGGVFAFGIGLGGWVAFKYHNDKIIPRLTESMERLCKAENAALQIQVNEMLPVVRRWHKMTERAFIDNANLKPLSDE